VIEKVNSSEYGLACGIFSNDRSILDRMTDEVEVGMIWHNTYNFIPPWLPFGGFKKSGHGRELGIQALETFSRTKSIFKK
jgi:acyl-CoA reductase-like NAD-dependent aldehyde dehydrogenase